MRARPIKTDAEESPLTAVLMVGVGVVRMRVCHRFVAVQVGVVGI